MALIKRSAAKNSLIFHNAFLSQENGPADFFPIAKDDMPFTPNGILTYSLRRVRHTGSVLHSNLAKSPPFLRAQHFCENRLPARLHKSVLSLDSAGEQHSQQSWI